MIKKYFPRENILKMGCSFPESPYTARVIKTEPPYILPDFVPGEHSEVTIELGKLSSMYSFTTYYFLNYNSIFYLFI